MLRPEWHSVQIQRTIELHTRGPHRCFSSHSFMPTTIYFVMRLATVLFAKLLRCKSGEEYIDNVEACETTAYFNIVQCPVWLCVCIVGWYVVLKWISKFSAGVCECVCLRLVRVRLRRLYCTHINCGHIFSANFSGKRVCVCDMHAWSKVFNPGQE